MKHWPQGSQPLPVYWVGLGSYNRPSKHQKMERLYCKASVQGKGNELYKKKTGKCLGCCDCGVGKNLDRGNLRLGGCSAHTGSTRLGQLRLCLLELLCITNM